VTADVTLEAADVTVEAVAGAAGAAGESVKTGTPALFAALLNDLAAVEVEIRGVRVSCRPIMDLSSKHFRARFGSAPVRPAEKDPPALLTIYNEKNDAHERVVFHGIYFAACSLPNRAGVLFDADNPSHGSVWITDWVDWLMYGRLSSIEIRTLIDACDRAGLGEGGAGGIGDAKTEGPTSAPVQSHQGGG